MNADFVDRLLRLTGARPRVLLAFSGGLDSTALAYALAHARGRLASLRFAHVDHGLQSASAQWSRDCARHARTWRVPFVKLAGCVGVRGGESLEAAARDLRYSLLASALEPGEVLVTAQHRDDQVETLLLQLFRGAGVSGLAAMPAWAPFARGHIARPLLDVDRATLERYARAHALRWIDDPTNAETRFDRNYLRQRVLPSIRERWPGAPGAIARSARHMAAADVLLDELATRDLRAAADGADLAVSALRALPAARRRNALRKFIADAGVIVPPSRQLQEIASALLEARADAQPEVCWAGGTIRRRAGRLELRVNPEHTAGEGDKIAAKSWRWKRQRELSLNERGDRLELVDDAAGPVDLDRLPAVLRVRARRGGESLRPGPNARTRPLKKLLQAAKLTVEERGQLPLLFGDGPKGRLLAAGDRWLDASVMANVKSRRRARLVWHREKAGRFIVRREK